MLAAECEFSKYGKTGEKMEAEMIAVLAMAGAFLAFGVWLQMQSRREAANSAQENRASNTAEPQQNESGERIGKGRVVPGKS